jgi:hypothetical protein
MKELILAMVVSEVFIGVVLVFIVAGISLIVKKTNTKKDDLVWSWIVKAFQLAEKLPAIEGTPSWVAKTSRAIQVLNEEYFAKYGSNPPENIVEFAKSQWTLLSQELKKKQ